MPRKMAGGAMSLEYYMVCEDCGEILELGKNDSTALDQTATKVYEFCETHHGHIIRHVSEMNVEPYENYKVVYI